ncbi:hypothetical protein [Saudi moumouvirus]|nr:hypothetical protein [Saudi moumouvirus]
MNVLCDDIWLIIILLINDKDKTNLFSTCKYLRYFRDKIYYTDIHDYRRVLYLPFYNKFKLLCYTAETPIIPNGIKYLTIANNFCGNLKNIPSSVEVITIDYSIYNRFEPFLKRTNIKVNILNKPSKRYISRSLFGPMNVFESPDGPKIGLISPTFRRPGPHNDFDFFSGDIISRPFKKGNIYNKPIDCGVVMAIHPSGFNTEDGLILKNYSSSYDDLIDEIYQKYNTKKYSEKNLYESIIKSFITPDPSSKKTPLKKLLKKYNKKDKIYHPHNNKVYKNNKYNQKFIPRHK